MYSPDGRKEWYLEECRNNIYDESTAELIKKIFISTELSEITFDKDVCDFSDAEVIDLFKSFNSKSRSRLRNTAWFLSRYHQWCYDKGLTEKIDDAFDDRTIHIIIKDIIPSEILMNSYFDKKYYVEFIELEPDYINRMIMLCLYYGIKGENLSDLRNLKISDLNEQEKTVSLLSGRKAFVDEYFIHTMKKAHNTEEYLQLIQSANIKKPNQNIYFRNDYIIRSCINEKNSYDDNPVKEGFITRRLQKIKTDFEVSFVSVSNLYKNGLINYVKEKYEVQNISLKTALMYNDGNYVYDKETEKYISEFGSKMTARILRRELREIIDKI